MSTKKTAARVLPGILAAVALTLVAVFAFGQAQTAQAIAGSTPQEKWNSFKQAVEAGGTVTLDEDLIAFSKIDVSKAATVNGTGTIYRYADDANFPVFNVTSGGDLTLAGDVVLSGKKKGCSEDSGDDGGDTVGEEGQVVWWNFGNEALSASNSDEVFGYSQIWDNDENGHEAGTWNMWKINAVNGNTLTLWTTNNYSSAEKELDFSTSDYNFYDINNIGTNLTEFFAGDYVFAISKGSSGAGSGSGSGSGSGGSQGCDADGSCGDYTSDDFNSGTPDAARGFFVQVDGGEATLAGATLTDFVADGSVHHVAPVAVNNGGTFDVTSGSITHNSVGYTADNSYWDAPAYSFGGRAIGKEDETGTGTYNGAMAGWAKTETAGGIIYNNGSSGTISGGDISGNRGDTGGVLVQGQGNNETDVNATKTDGATSKVKLTGGAIDNNLGVHHGGGMSVYNGAAVQMDGGTISDNFSWHKGGGVFVSEEVFGSMRAVDYYGEPARIKAGSAAFTMNDGTISGNVAVLRGGGINVTSDHVALLGGSILNNNARVLGGGVYVEGDSGRMYQLYVANGCISGNSALSVAEEGAASSGPSNTAGGCNFDNALATPNTDVTYVDGFWGEKGDGGGLWLCPLGGNATFAISEGHNVIIGGNSASSNGTDIYVTQPRSGVGNGVNVVSLGANNDFTDQATGAKLQANTTYAGELALANSVQECDGKLTIQGNSAPNGGGIGANGTVIFGEAQDTYRTSAGLELTKVWGSDRSKDPITLKLYAQVGGQKVELGEVTLDGVADNEGEAAEDFNENTALYESAPWVASIGLPLAVTMPDGTTRPLFTTSAGDPSDPAVLKAIYGSGEELSLADWNLVIEEADASGKAMTYVLPSGDATLDNVEKSVETEVSYTDIDGNPLASAGTYSVNFSFSQEIANDNEPTIEKYVAKDVHKDIAIDEVYPYDILAYVPLTADAIQITDVLDSQLQFADDADAIAATAVVKDANDHTVGGTVAAGSETKIAATAKIDGQTLTVDVADATAARGKYIQITFNAKIKDGLAYSDLDLTPEVTKNDPVKGGAEAHGGIVNDASYKIKTGNDWSSDYKSNEVTVKPEEEKPEIEKYVNKNVHADIKLADTFTYDIVAYVTRDADNLVVTDELDSQLQFVSKDADVKVVSLGATVDHTPNGSVAGEGTAVDGAVAKISGQTLTVTIADAKALRGQWVKVTFDAKIKDGLTVDGLKLTQVKDADEESRTAPNKGNDPVVTDEDHEGVPNAASYTIGVGNKANAYSDTSNTVTVKPTDTPKDDDKPSGGDDTPKGDDKPSGGDDTPKGDDKPNGGEGDNTGGGDNPSGNTGDDGKTFPVVISKQDITDSSELPGAVITIRDANGTVVETWTSTDQPHALNLAPGRYTLEEVNAPEGFQSITTVVTFVVDENGNVTLEGAYEDINGAIAVQDVNHLVLSDLPTKVTISKQAVGGGAELPGATLVILDADGNEVARHVSTNEPWVIEKLPAGTYILREITAPNGYEVAEDMTFRINADGTVECLQNGEWVDANDHVVMFDAPSSDKPTERDDDGTGGNGNNNNPNEDDGTTGGGNPARPTGDNPSSASTTPRTTTATSASATPRTATGTSTTATSSAARSVATKTGDDTAALALVLGLAAAVALSIGAYSLRRRNER